MDPRFRPDVVADVHSKRRNELFAQKRWDPNMAWDSVICIISNESLLIDGVNVRLHYVKGMLLPRNRHLLTHTSNGVADMARTDCHTFL